jgi:hypothetical protein
MKLVFSFFTAALLVVSCESKVSNSNQPSQIHDVAEVASPTVEALPESFYKKFTGNVGELPIVMDLNRDSTKLTGSYYYSKVGIPMLLEGTIQSDGSFELKEFNDEMVNTARMFGVISPTGTLTGTWQHVKKGNTLPLQLLEKTIGIAQVSFNDFEKKNCKFEGKLNKEMFDAEYGCTTLSVRMANVSTTSPDASRKINTSIFQSACESANLEREISSMEQLMDRVNISSPDEGFNGEIFFSMVSNDNNILTLSKFSSWYNFGAAHPEYYTLFDNYDIRTGEKIRLEDILISNYEYELNRIAEPKFMEKYGTEGDWDFEPGNFQLSKNFAVMPGGLLFHFNPYEVGPYSSGAPELFLSFKEINRLLNPNGMLAMMKR